MKTKYLLIIILGFLSTSGSAQKAYHPSSIDQLVALSWEINVPGNSDLISKTSLSGGRFEYRKFLNHHFSVGLGISMSSVEQYYNTMTYEKADGSTAVTTDMIRQGFVMPMTITGHYYFDLANHMLKPYAGLGIGGQYASEDLYYNIYVINHNDWGFVVRPEIGTLVIFNESAAALGSIGWNYSTNKVSDLGGNKSLKQVCFNIGIALMME
jgi:outer membrane protein W